MDWARVSTPAALEGWHGVLGESYEHDFVALPADPIGEYEPLLDDELIGGHRKEMWLGTADAGPVVAALLEMSVHENLAEVEIELAVAPAWRRRGWATAAAGRIADRCRALDRTLLTVEVPGPLDGEPSPARSFAAGQGFAVKQTEVRRLLDVSAVDDAHIDALERSAVTRAHGYRLVSWTDRVGDDLVDGLATLAGRMSTDVPWGERAYEPEVWDAARWRAAERSSAARGRREIGTAALYRDEVVAYTVLHPSRPRPAVGYQGDT
ncbi:MAG: hypothetical protein ACRDTP_06430, partial [Mycobacteriales bacterium]